VSTLRRAERGDLAEIDAIFREAELEPGEIRVADSAEPLPIFAHELCAAEVWVAEDGGEIVGFATRVERGRTAFLAELFVRGSRRSAGVGRALLERCFDARGCERSTLASSDPRALALYVELGLEPRWPLVYLVGDSVALAPPSVPADARARACGVEELERLDERVSGRHRAEDLEHWRADGRAAALVIHRADREIGYALVRERSDDWVGHRDDVTIGPAGSFDPADLEAVITAALQAREPRRALVRIAVPGPSAALRPLLRAGFRIAELDTFLAGPGPLGFDARAYVPSGGALF
jgi:GNAT superfamily N-acetyltransferase